MLHLMNQLVTEIGKNQQQEYTMFLNGNNIVCILENMLFLLTDLENHPRLTASGSL